MQQLSENKGRLNHVINCSLVPRSNAAAYVHMSVKVSKLVLLNFSFQVLDFQSLFQSRTIPIPLFQPVDSHSVTFVGRLANEILRITDTHTTSFIEQRSAWYDKRTMQEVLNIKIWEKLKVGGGGRELTSGFLSVKLFNLLCKCLQISPMSIY